jgi:DDE superfamily endonuclease
VPIEIAENEMASIRTIVSTYNRDDVFNMDETALFWRLALNRGLSTVNIPGLKKAKDRVTIVACVNSTGSIRLPLWFIGKAKTPHALRRVNTEALGCIWRWNQKAWMKTDIMAEWLRFFYSVAGSNNRRILLLLDNFSAHLAGIEEAPPPDNIRVIFLPANSTARFQPLDQGIIANFKVYYRKQWLDYCIEQALLNKDPIKTMNIRQCLIFAVEAWKLVRETTIQNCYKKSSVLIEGPVQRTIDSPSIEDLAQEGTGIEASYERIASVVGRSQIMEIGRILNPIEETLIEASIEEMGSLEEIIDHHLAPDSEEAIEGDNSELLIKLPTTHQALDHAQQLFEYLSIEDPDNSQELQVLRDVKQRLVGRAINTARQTQIDSFFRPIDG